MDRHRACQAGLPRIGLGRRHALAGLYRYHWTGFNLGSGASRVAPEASSLSSPLSPLGPLCSTVLLVLVLVFVALSCPTNTGRAGTTQDLRRDQDRDLYARNIDANAGRAGSLRRPSFRFKQTSPEAPLPDTTLQPTTLVDTASRRGPTMPLPAGASSSSSSLRSRGQVPAHLALAPPSTPGNALGPDGQPLPSPSKGFPHPTYHLPAAPGAAPMKAAGTAGGPGAGAVNPKRETSGGKRTTTTTTTSKTSATSNTASERAAKRPTNLLTGMDLAVRSAPSSDPDDGRSPVRMSPSSPLFPSTSTPSPSPSPFSTPNLDANHSSANHHGRAKSSPGVLNDGSATHRDGRSRPNSWIVPSPVLASPSSRHSRRHGPSPTDEEDIARRVVSNVGEFGALGIVISDPDASSSSSASASATSSPSTSSLDTFSPFGGAFAAMTRSPKVGAQTYAAYPTPSNGAAGRLAAAAATESATPKANGIVGGYPASRPPQSSPLVRTYTSHRGSHSSHDALMSSASPPPPYPISPLNNAAYRKSSSARGGDTKSSAKSGFSGALRNALKRLYSDSPLATVPPGPDRTFYHQHQLSLVDPPAASSRRSMMSAIKNPLSFLSAPVDPFVDSHARSPPPPPSDGRFDDNTGASSAAYFEGSSRGTSPTSHSRRQTSGPQSTSRFEKTLLLASSTSSVGSAASSLPRSSSFGSAPGTPLGGSRNRRLPTPSNVRRLMSLIVVCLGIWTVVYLLLRLTPFGSSLSYPSSSSSDWANLDRHGIFRAHQTVAEKERMKTTIIKNGKQTIKTLSPKEEKDVKLRAVAKETAEKAKQIAALCVLCLFRWSGDRADSGDIQVAVDGHKPEVPVRCQLSTNGRGPK